MGDRLLSFGTLVRWVLPALVLLTPLVVVAAYWGVWTHGLIFDDGGLAALVSQYASLDALRPRLLAYGSFAWFEQGFAWAHGGAAQRVVNLTIHGGVVVGLFVLHRGLFSRLPNLIMPEGNGWREPRAPIALGVAVLMFAAHPVASYAAGYLIQRSILMATLFVVWGLVAFSRALRGGHWVCHLLAVCCYILAMLSKEYALAAPVVAFGIFIWLARPSRAALLRLGFVFCALTGLVGALLLTRYAHVVGEAFDPAARAFVVQLGKVSPEAAEQAYGLSMLNQAWLFFRYGFFWFVPNVWAMSIDMRPPFPTSFASFPHMLGVVGYVALTGLALWLLLKRQDRWGLFGLYLLMPLVLFVTEFSSVWIQDPFVLYRSYLWAIPLPGIWALGLMRLRMDNLLAFGACLVVVLAILAHERVSSMRDSYTVWSDAVQKVDLEAPDAAVGRWRAFMNRGTFHLGNRALEPATHDFEMAARLGEPFGTVEYSLGAAYNMLGKHTDAVRALDSAVEKGFTDPAVFYERGKAQARLNRTVEAFDDFSRMLETTSDPRVKLLAHKERGEIGLRLGRMTDVVTDYSAILAAKPEDQKARFNLGMALVALKRYPDALTQFRDMLRADNSNAAASYGLALAYHLSGDHHNARAMIDRAVQLDERNPTYKRLQADIAAGAAAN